MIDWPWYWWAGDPPPWRALWAGNPDIFQLFHYWAGDLDIDERATPPPPGVRSERATLILFSCFNDERATMILMSGRLPWLACVVRGQPRYFSFFIDERATPLIGERRELAGNFDIIQMFYWWARNLDIGERATPPITHEVSGQPCYYSVVLSRSRRHPKLALIGSISILVS